MKVLVGLGTRPEIIKLARVIHGLAAAPEIELVVISTGQHQHLLAPHMETFGLKPDVDLCIFEHRQSLASITARILDRAYDLLGEIRPSVSVVQGDTTSVFAMSLASFYHGFPVAHVEAGLRTFDLAAPFPEEMNRSLVSRLTDLHFAPTERSRSNLLREGIPSENVLVTGNTVIDALLWATGRGAQLPDHISDQLCPDRPVMLVTAHRRESWGPPMRSIAGAILDLASRNPDWLVVFPMHPNPLLRQAVTSILESRPNVLLTEPLSYVPFAQLMSRSTLILTDSGGIQEEAPALSKPVLVLRDKTERPEAVEAGAAVIAGTDREAIVAEAERLIIDQGAYKAMAAADNPFGDGRAAERIVQALLWKWSRAERPDEFRS